MFHFQVTVDIYSLLRKTSDHPYCYNEVQSTFGHSHQDRHQSPCCTCHGLCNVHTAVGSHCRSGHQSKLWQRQSQISFNFLFTVEMSPAISLVKAVQLSLSEKLSTSIRTVLVESAEALCQQLR